MQLRIIKKIFQDTFIAFKNVGILSTLKLYFSVVIDKLFYFDSKYDLSTVSDPKDTIPNHPSVNFSEIYLPSREKPFKKLLKSLDINLDNACFVDFGCGKGRTLMTASNFGIKKLKGIEFCDTLSSIASENINIYLKDNSSNSSKFEIINQDMSTYEVQSDENFFYFYNPCSELILTKVIRNIILSFSQKPRKGFIVYQNNSIKHPSFFDRYDELSYLFCKEFSGNKFFVYKIDTII